MKKTRMYVLCALFAALTAVGAFCRIPVGITSITMQFAVTAMAGVLLGKKYGPLSQLLYVLLGLVGLPVFTLGGGFSYVLQPSFGYLLGLIPACWVMGACTEKAESYWAFVRAMLLGMVILYAVGLPYMALILNGYLAEGLSARHLAVQGMLLFLPGDFVKIAVCAGLCKRLKPRLIQFTLP